MKCQGRFIYKGLDKVDGGSFTNANGQVINYDGSYKLKLDEWNEGKLNDIKLKVPEKSKDLIENLQKLKPYTEILVDCDVLFYNSVARVVPISFKIADSNNK